MQGHRRQEEQEDIEDLGTPGPTKAREVARGKHARRYLGEEEEEPRHTVERAERPDNQANAPEHQSHQQRFEAEQAYP